MNLIVFSLLFFLGLANIHSGYTTSFSEENKEEKLRSNKKSPLFTIYEDKYDTGKTINQRSSKDFVIYELKNQKYSNKMGFITKFFRFFKK